jgi:hypothetical protein
MTRFRRALRALATPLPWTVNTAVQAVYAVVFAGEWAWFAWLIAAVSAAAAIMLWAVQRRRPAARAARDLLAAAKAHRDGAWLDRDARQSLSVATWRYGFRWWLIRRVPEDAVLEADDGEGERPMLTELFYLMPLSRRVIREDFTVLYDPASGKTRSLPAVGSRRQRRRQQRQAWRAGLGMVPAPLAQVTELIGQLRASERVGHGEEPE